MRNGANRVINAPTSAGKTYTASTTQWLDLPEVTGKQPVFIFSPTTDARDDAFEKSFQSEASAGVLYGRTDACPLAGGDYDSDNEVGNTPISAPDGSDPSEWFNTMCRGRGHPFSVAHGVFERAHDDHLPCSPEGERCQSVTQWSDIPRNDDDEIKYDVIHATHQFARVPQLIEGCNLIIDELPDFSLDKPTESWRQSITSCLKEIDAPPERWEELLVGTRLGFNFNSLDKMLTKPDLDWFLDDPDAHALTPGIVQALLNAEQRQHGRWVGTTRYEYPDLNPQHDGPDYEVLIRIVFDEDDNIQLLQEVPDFSEARCVIGLDAFPTMPKWKANTLPSMEETQVITAEDRQRWRRNERNLKIVQIGDDKNTWTKQGFNSTKVGILCDDLRWKYGDYFRTGVTAMESEEEFEQLLRDAGVDSPDTIHFGEEKSIERFDSEEVGLIAGCVSPSDEDIKHWMALLDKDATPVREVEWIDDDGQRWIGPDDGVANELIADVREKRVLQACGRYARSPEDPEDRGIVYVFTNVLPPHYIDEMVEKIYVLGDKQREIFEYLDGSTWRSGRDIIENTSSTRKHVYKTLNKYVEIDYSTLHVDRDAGESHNPDLYRTDRAPDGMVEISPENHVY